MSDVYTNTIIEETPFPNDEQAVLSTELTSGSTNVPTNTQTKDSTYPTRKIATELIGSALNTKSKKILKEFEFTGLNNMDFVTSGYYKREKFPLPKGEVNQKND